MATPLPSDLAPPPYGERTTLVHLMATLIGARGGRSPHPPLAGLDPAPLAAARHLVYLVIDGLGARQLAPLTAAGALRGRLTQPDLVLSTVFPATTATAVTTLMTGASPAEHAILGWHLNLPDLGVVATILLGESRTGTPLAPPEFDLGAYLAVPSHLDSVPAAPDLVAPAPIPDSRFSRALGRWRRRVAVTDLAGLEEAVATLCRGPGPGLVYAYWPGYDGHCHESGPFSEPALAHLAAVEATVERLEARLRGTGTALLVSADHGMVDSSPETCIDLSRIPGLYDCLATLPAGDPRALACFVRPGRVDDFRALVAEHLAGVCHCLEGEALAAAGVFGPGPAHPALRQRIGDFLLVARDRWALFAPARDGRTPWFPVGNHGGMTPGEMEIPLYLLADAT